MHGHCQLCFDLKSKRFVLRKRASPPLDAIDVRWRLK